MTIIMADKGPVVLNGHDKGVRSLILPMTVGFQCFAEVLVCVLAVFPPGMPSIHYDNHCRKCRISHFMRFELIFSFPSY